MMSPKMHNLIEDTYAIADKHDVTIKMVDEKHIPYPSGGVVAGYFLADDKSRELGIATGDENFVWWPVVVHESCHMDQWLENDPTWLNNMVGHFEADDLFSLWVSRLIELNPSQLKDYMSRVRNCELNCEIRAVEKIKKYGLEDVIDPERYIKQGNAYVFYHTFVTESRSWWETGKAAYNNESILELMPSNFLAPEEYDVVPDNIREAFRLILPEQPKKDKK